MFFKLHINAIYGIGKKKLWLPSLNFTQDEKGYLPT